MEPGIAAALVVRVARGARIPGALNDPVCHLDLGASAALRELLDRMPVAIARGKVERRKVRARAQDLVDPTHALEELFPVERRHQAHARDDVADRHVHGRLPLVLEGSDLFARGALGRELLVEPAQRRDLVGILLAQPLGELDGKGRGQGLLLQARQHRTRVRRRPLPEAEQRVRQEVRFLARRSPLHDELRDATEVLDQQDAQRDRDGPQFADHERLHMLVGLHEPAERLGLEAAVGVGDERPGEADDARVSLEEALGELRQLAIEAPRQILANFADLLVDDVEVVDQPFRGRGDRALLAYRLRERPICREQDTAVVGEPRQQGPPAARIVRHALSGGETLGMLLEALAAEQLGADGLVGVRQSGVRGTERAEELPNGLDLYHGVAISAIEPPVRIP
jgi:hypothetical protein